jgi:hypothetical protein
MSLFRTLFVIMLVPTFAFAQQQSKLDGMGIEANLFYGHVMKHTQKFLLPQPEFSTGCDINLLYHTFGRKDWHQRRRYPTIGIAFSYINYGIDSVYGKCFGLYPNITIPLITSKRVEWTLRLGNGIGYVTRKYDRFPITDTMNNAIGSHINDFASFFTSLRYHVSKHLDIQAGVNFNHISDASYHQPNLGINLLAYHVGVRYFPTTSSPKKQHKELPTLSNRVLLQGRVAFAFTQSEAAYGPLYPVYMASVFGSKRWLSKNKGFVGIDYSYHEGVQAFLRNNEIDPGRENSQSWKSAVFVGNEFLLGRLGVVLQVGVYLKQAYLALDPYYQKVGGNYYLLQREKGPIKELCITGMLKTHKSNAELAEFGIGFGF